MIMNKICRIGVVVNVVEKKLKQSEAANILSFSKSQTKRLVKRQKNNGATGLISRKTIVLIEKNNYK